MQRLNDHNRSMIALILRSDDRGDGWRAVSPILVKLFDNVSTELVESKLQDGDYYVRLTPEGSIVAKWM